MTTPEFVTIGVYGFAAEDFFRALQQAGVDTFCDLRARRGVRGAQYAFANSQRLQARLAEMGVRYLHFPQLAPSKALRQRQSEADRAARQGKRQRSTLSPAFIAGYQTEVMDSFDSAAFLAELPADARIVALFCVEGEPAACHRSLLAQRLADDLGVKVRHVVPERASDN